MQPWYFVFFTENNVCRHYAMKDLFASKFNCLIWNNNVIGVKTNVKNWNAVLLNQFYIICVPVMLYELTGNSLTGQLWWLQSCTAWNWTSYTPLVRFWIMMCRWTHDDKKETCNIIVCPSVFHQLYDEENAIRRHRNNRALFSLSNTLLISEDLCRYVSTVCWAVWWPSGKYALCVLGMSGHTFICICSTN